MPEPTNSPPATIPRVRDATRSILEFLSVDEAVAHIAGLLHQHAEPGNRWGTQEAVSRWLETLALDLDDCVEALRRTP